MQGRLTLHVLSLIHIYAMDMLDSYLRKSGVTSAVVDFGGSILTIGKDNGNSRRISITADEDVYKRQEECR